MIALASRVSGMVRRIDHLALRLPFGGDRLRQRKRRRGKHPAGRRAHRLAVEGHGIAFGRSRHFGCVIETLRRAGRAPRRAAVMGFPGSVFEQVAHET